LIEYEKGEIIMNICKVIPVIKSTLTRRGNGKNDPIRIITEYFSMDGEKLAEVDPCFKNEDLFDLLEGNVWYRKNDRYIEISIDDGKTWDVLLAKKEDQM
jgi:hypothetical protein